MGYKLTGAYIYTARLPSEYQEVEYIESSGTQYFIVGTSFKTSYKSIIDLEMVVTGGDYIPLGVHNDAGKRYGIDAYGGKFTVISGGGSWTNTATEDTNRHLITIDKTTATVDGTSYSISYVDYTYNKGVGVFGYHNTQTDGVNYKSSNKLYKLDIYDENGTQIYDLVPCYRKLDSVIGMYDIINDVFYTNSGTGTFTKGSDVGPTEIKVRPSKRHPGANTLLYMPLSSNANDVQGHTTTTGGTVRFGSYGGVDCADFTSRGHINITPFALGNSYTILARANNVNGAYESNGGRVVDLGNPRVGIAYRSPEGYYTYENNDYFGVTTQNAWFLTAVVVTGSTGVGYLKGNGVDDTSSLVSCFNSGTPTAFNIGNEYNNGANRYFLGYISNVIVEDKARTAQEIADYYNQTKSDYGL